MCSREKGDMPLTPIEFFSQSKEDTKIIREFLLQFVQDVLSGAETVRPPYEFCELDQG